MRRSDVASRARAARALAPAPVTAGEAPAIPDPARKTVISGFRALPAAFWLVAIVSISVAYRITGVVTGMENPWVFFDEIVYAELGRSLAEGDGLQLRDQAGSNIALGVVYPLLLAPVYAVAPDLPTAYAVVKVVNALIMSSAAVPAYLLARRILTPGRALFAAGFAVSLPALAHTGTVMTENAFYPVFLWFAFAAFRCLERPTGRRQLVVLALAALAALTRAQGAALVPAFVTAVALSAWLDARAGRGGRRTLRRYLVTWTGVSAGILALGAYALRRSGSSADLVGVYAPVFDTVRLEHLPRALVSHVAILDLSAGVAPFAGAILLAVAVYRRRTTPRADAFLALTVGLSSWLVLTAATFSTIPLEPPRIQERYLFYAVPLLFVALLATIEQTHRRGVVALTALVAALLPALLPFDAVLTRHAHSSTPALIPWQLGSPRTALVGTTVLATALAATMLRRRGVTMLAPIAAVSYVLLLAVVVDAAFVFRADARREHALGANAGWIDDAVGPSKRVALIWSGKDRAGVRGQYAVWQNEFFNAAVGRVYALGPTSDGLPVERLVVDRTSGALRNAATGSRLSGSHFLADRFTRLRGRVVARDRSSGMTLYAVQGVATMQSPACRRVRPWVWGGDRCAGAELAHRLRRVTRGGGA